MKISGGDKLEKALGGIAKNVANAVNVEVGFMGDATEPTGANTAMVAAIQEFGAPKAGIPPRPFFRTMIADHSKEWPANVAALLKHNDYDARKTLDQTGEEIAGELQDSIINMSEPGLSEVTLMLRQMVGPDGQVESYSQVQEARDKVARGERASGVSTKPLVWTGALLNSVRHVVKD